MKKQKVALHWQILIAIVLAIIYGLVFPTKYKFTGESFEEFSKQAKVKGF